MRQYILLATIVLGMAAPAAAQQTPKHPELVGIPSAAPGLHADRYVFEYFKSAPDALFNTVRVTVSPGHSVAMHSHSGPEFHYILSGQAEEVQGNEAPRKVKAGDWGFAPEGVAHGLKNTGTEPMTFLGVIVGKKGVRLTQPFKK
jgi:quercetin dioxygenase-like cupin family protein